MPDTQPTTFELDSNEQEVLEAIRGGGETFSYLAQQTGLKNWKLDRVLRSLRQMGLVARTSEGRFTVTKAGRQ